MKKALLIVGLLVLLGGATGWWYYGNPFLATEQKAYGLAKKLYPTLLKRPEGATFDKEPVICMYDNGHSAWRVGTMALVTNGFGVKEKTGICIEFRPKDNKAIFNQESQWEVIGYVIGDEYEGSMTRFKEPEPTLDDISIDDKMERVSEYGIRTAYIKITNHAKKNARVIEAEAFYFDRNENMVESSDGTIYNVAPGATELIKCTLYREVYGAKTYKVKIKSVSFDK